MAFFDAEKGIPLRSRYVHRVSDENYLFRVASSLSLTPGARYQYLPQSLMIIFRSMICDS